MIRDQQDLGANWAIDELIEYNYVTGYVVDIIENINESINRLKATNAKVKIGVTSREPREYFEEQMEKFDWDRMIVIYDTCSTKFVRDLKTHLININWFDLENERGLSTGNYTLFALVKE